MVAEPLIESVPLDDLSGDDAAPRRRGRRPMTPEEKAARNERDRNRRASRGGSTRSRTSRPSSPRRSSPKSLYPEIVAALTVTNTVLSLTPLGSSYEATGAINTIEVAPGLSVPMPELRLTKLGDELDDAEIMQLAVALDRQCQRSPRFRRYVELVLSGVSGGGILGIVAMIAARRAARHGIIDPSYDARLGAMLTGDISALASITPPPDPNATIPETGEQPPRREAGDDPDYESM